MYVPKFAIRQSEAYPQSWYPTISGHQHHGQIYSQICSFVIAMGIVAANPGSESSLDSQKPYYTLFGYMRVVVHAISKRSQRLT